MFFYLVYVWSVNCCLLYRSLFWLFSILQREKGIWLLLYKSSDGWAHAAPSVQCHFESFYCWRYYIDIPSVARHLEILTGFVHSSIYRTSMFPFESIKLLEKLFLFSLRNTWLRKNWSGKLNARFILRGILSICMRSSFEKKNPKRKITNKWTFFITKFGLSLLFEKLFVFTRWRAKSTSW